MLSIFATPKPFHGHMATIQRNAITSWMALPLRPEIILFGDEPGTAEICRELGLTHVPALACTPYGAPVLPDLFEKAQRLAGHSLLAYVNADIILMSDFIHALELARDASDKFLMVARVWRVRIDDRWNFRDSDVERRLRSYVQQRGKQAPPPGSSDFFAFPRGLWSSIPPFGIGRGFWDFWLIYQARRLGAAVVDASTSVMAVHQNHDQSTYPHGLRRWRQEINHNYSLAGKQAASFCLYDATHLLNRSGLHRARGIRYLSRYIDTLPLLHPLLAAPLRVPQAAIAGVRWLRQTIALAQDAGVRLVKLVQSKLPSDGVTAILGLAKDSPGQLECVRGLSLAYALLMGGYPVVAYDPDPSVIEKARRDLTGPLELAASPEECAKQGDVVVIAAAREEFRQIPATLLARRERSCVVIDCCDLWHPKPAHLGIEYLAWAER